MKNYRRDMYSLPEDATAVRGTYLDCSSFVNSVYYNLFGRDVVIYPGYSRVDTYILNEYAKTEWAKGNNKAIDVLYYVNTADYNNDTDRANLLNKILSELEVGDLIVYRHGSSSGSSGHVMLYVGNNTILHSTGSSFAINETNPMKGKDNATSAEASGGTVQLLDTSTVFTKSTSTRYLFNDGSASSDAKVWSFAILRPLNNNWSLSEQGQARATILGLMIEKSSSSQNMSSVLVGDTITYTIKLVNKGNTTLKNIEVKDVLSNLVSLQSGSINNNGTINNSIITWNISEIKANQTISLTYSVKVKNDTEVGSVIESNDATVNGARINKISHTVIRNVNYDTIKANTLALQSNELYSDFREAIYKAYEGVIDKTILASYLPSKTLLYSLLHVESGYKLNKEHASYPIMLPDFYGGLWLQFKDRNQIRLVKNEHLKTGDIILTRYNDASDNKIYTAYIYIDSSTIIQIDSSGNIKNIVTSSFTSDLFLTQLIGYKLYTVLRPSLIK